MSGRHFPCLFGPVCPAQVRWPGSFSPGMLARSGGMAAQAGAEKAEIAVSAA
jgi:hypothetical protein